MPLNKLKFTSSGSSAIINLPANLTLFDEINFDNSIKQSDYDFLLLFARNMEELQTLLPKKLPLIEDGLMWIAYPKKNSAIKSDLNRDKLWNVLAHIDYRPVSLVSLDTTWSVVRFRQEKFVKSRPQQSAKVVAANTPKEIADLLKPYASEKKYFESLSPSNKKEYIEWITSAKRLETKQRRLDKMLAMLSNKMKNPYAK